MRPANKPADATLAKYGLSYEEWLELAGEACRVCEREWNGGKPVVDHRHVRGWKMMRPEDRRKYVRGVVCIMCNHYILSRYLTPLRARNAAAYLEDFDARTD